jgi:hypothetical protein
MSIIDSDTVAGLLRCLLDELNATEGRLAGHVFIEIKPRYRLSPDIGDTPSMVITRLDSRYTADGTAEVDLRFVTLGDFITVNFIVQ